MLVLLRLFRLLSNSSETTVSEDFLPFYSVLGFMYSQASSTSSFHLFQRFLPLTRPFGLHFFPRMFHHFQHVSDANFVNFNVRLTYSFRRSHRTIRLCNLHLGDSMSESQPFYILYPLRLKEHRPFEDHFPSYIPEISFYPACILPSTSISISPFIITTDEPNFLKFLIFLNTVPTIFKPRFRTSLGHMLHVTRTLIFSYALFHLSTLLDLFSLDSARNKMTFARNKSVQAPLSFSSTPASSYTHTLS